MNVLALDLATKTGWAHTCGMSGVQDFARRRGDSPGMLFIDFRAWLIRFLDQAQTELIVYEQAGIHRSGAATHVAHGLISAAEVVAAERKIEITNRSPSAIKNFILPDVPVKRRNKPKMIQAAENRWPHIEMVTDDQADAILLLWFAMDDLKITDTVWHRTIKQAV